MIVPCIDLMGGMAVQLVRGREKKLEVVYVLNKLQTAIRDVVVQARDGDFRLYSYTLGDSGEGTMPLPFQPPPPKPPHPPAGGAYDASELVRPRKQQDRGKKLKPD